MKNRIIGNGIARIVVGSGNNRSVHPLPSDASPAEQDKFREQVKNFVARPELLAR